MTKKIILLQYAGRNAPIDAGYVIEGDIDIPRLFDLWCEKINERHGIDQISEAKYKKFLEFLDEYLEDDKISGIEQIFFGMMSYLDFYNG